MSRPKNKRRVLLAVGLGIIAIAWLNRSPQRQPVSFSAPPMSGYADGFGGYGGYASPADAWLPQGDRFQSNGLLGTASNFDSQGNGYINLGNGQSVSIGF